MRLKMRYFAFVSCTIFISCGFSSCKKNQDKYSTTYTPELVINSIFTPDSVFQVEVTRTKEITEPRGMVYINDAIVQIYEGNVLLEQLSFKQLNNFKGYYRGEGERAEASTVYTVVVKAEGYHEVSATNTVPAIVEVIGSETKNSQVVDNSIRGDLVFNFQEPAEVENYYHLIVHRPIIREDEINGIYEVVGYSLENVHPTDIDFISDYSGGFLFTDGQFNGAKKDVSCGFNTNFDASRAGLDHLVVELRSVSRDYYLYQKTLAEQHFNITKIIEVHSNVIDGYGIFAGYQSSIRIVEF